MIEKQHYEELAAKKEILFFRIICYLAKISKICNEKIERYKEKVLSNIQL